MGKTYLLSTNGKNEGPFTEQELTGKFLRGEIEATAQVCAVGGNVWEALSDSLRKSAARKQLVLIIVGVVFFWVGAVCGFNALSSGESETLAAKEVKEVEQTAAKEIAKLEDPAFLKEAGETIAENARALRLSASRIEENIETFVRSVRDDKARWTAKRDEARAKWNRIRGEGSGRKIAYGAVSVLTIALGTVAFVMGLSMKEVARPRLPGAPPSPSAPNLTSKRSVGQTSASATPTKPAVGQSLPNPAPAEPKALCSACRQKVAFPKEMAGHQIACPGCGAMMILDDCSDVPG